MLFKKDSDIADGTSDPQETTSSRMDLQLFMAHMINT